MEKLLAFVSVDFDPIKKNSILSLLSLRKLEEKRVF